MIGHELKLSAPTTSAVEMSDGRISLSYRPGMRWECTCCMWSKTRNERTGAPFLEGAKRAHRKHVKEMEARRAAEA